MGKVWFQQTMSLDGYTAGPEQTLEEPLGKGGEELHEWAVVTRAFHEMSGKEGGTTGLDDERMRRWNENVGAHIMGRNMFGPIRGDWGDEDWRGWWGEEPPYHAPVFVLTHYAHEPIEMQGGTTFHFVTDGIEAALAQAKEAAGGKDVAIAGGASTAQQYLRAGLVDEMEIHVVPLLLGAGERLFDNLDSGPVGYECVELVSSPAVAHYRYVRKGA
jgi:dihydrofolate reductase